MRIFDHATSLHPTLLSQLRAFAANGHFRSVRVRRLIAVALVIAAIASAVVSQHNPTSVPLVVAAIDLRPGSVITHDDITTKSVVVDTVPPGAFSAVDQAVGQRVTGAIRSGEILTASRLLTSHLPAALTGNPDARLVPVRPADESVLQLVRQGDLVDVVDAESTVLARAAVVAVAPLPEPGRSPTSVSAPILLAMDRQSAQNVAATGLGTALALVLH